MACLLFCVVSFTRLLDCGSRIYASLSLQKGDRQTGFEPGLVMVARSSQAPLTNLLAQLYRPRATETNSTAARKQLFLSQSRGKTHN
jgi:hypothetical protein